MILSEKRMMDSSVGLRVDLKLLMNLLRRDGDFQERVGWFRQMIWWVKMQPKAEESMSVSVVRMVRYLGSGMRVFGSVFFLALASIIKITKIIAKQLNPNTQYDTSIGSHIKTVTIPTTMSLFVPFPHNHMIICINQSNLIMIRTITKLLRCSISVSRVDLSLHQIKTNPKIDFFPIVGYRQQKLGACILNQPANQNILTEQFLDELYRFMLSYQFDHSVENVWIESKQNVFSHGLDYKRLTEDKHYLDKVARLAILFAKMNKPMFAQVAGGAKGAGAYLLSMITMPIGHSGAFLRIDDASRGMTPLLGGTHRMTRLPLHLGYYLALTGDELNFQEMTQIGYIKGRLCNDVTNSQIRSKLQQANLYFREKLRYTDFDDSKLQQQQKALVNKNKELYQSHLKYRQGQIISQSANNLNVKFAVNQHLAASSDYYNTLNAYNSFSQGEERHINNYYELRLERPLEYLKKNKLVQGFQIKGINIPRLDLAKIDYIFAKGSIEEIMEGLKAEESQWAQRAYQRMKDTDPLALVLTFELLKKAEGKPWVDCLENEFTVARRLIENSQLKLKTYRKSSQYVLINDYSNKTISEIPSQLISSYLAPGQGDYKLQHDVSSHSLHPYNDYYQLLPDSVRKYLNRQQFNDAYLNEQLPEVMRFLNKNKINYSSQVYDVNLLRKHIFQKLELEKEKEAIRTRLTFLSGNDRFLQTYKNQREEYLENVSNEVLDRKIKDQITSIFKNKFQSRFKDYEEKTANIIGLENKITLYKNIKKVILDNLMYNGAQYEDYQRNNTSYNGPIYFDKEGKDIYSSTNPHINADPTLNQLTKDLSKGLDLSQDFLRSEKVELPLFTATPEVALQKREVEERKVWELLKYRYDEKPEVWAQAYVYKQLVEQASRTSEELGGYLDWSFENFYDLLNYSQKNRETYGEFAADIVTQLKSIRKTNMDKLSQVQKQRKVLAEKTIYSKIYQLKDQEKMRACFPYYINQSTIPGEFRRSFLSVLDSTHQEFTQIGKNNDRKLLFKEELGIVDKWINKDIATSYTDLLKNDVQYVTSYLQILTVKDMLVFLKEHRNNGKTLEEIIDMIRDQYNVDFHFSTSAITMRDIHAKIFSFLYFLMDMHTKAKKHIQSPQSKLIDFINRLKQSHEENLLSSLPYSFESLILMIAKDRRRIYDRFIGEQFISQPEFYLQHVTRQAKRDANDILKRKQYHLQVAKSTFKGYVDKYSDAYQHQKKHLIQNYFYYMILFEKHIHEACGKDSFIPTGFINQQHKMYNKYCQGLFRPKHFDEWLDEQVKVVVEQLLDQRYEVEKKLTKGELYLFDQTFQEKLKPQSIRVLIQKKIDEEIYVLKNIFGEVRDYDFQQTEEEKSDEEYTRAKRGIVNTEALKKLNNLALAEEISLEYLEKAEDVEGMSPAQRRFARNQKQYFKTGMVSRLPSRSYHRMARDLFVYPEELNPTKTKEDIELFKKTNINFSKSASEKIVLSNFTDQYKTLSQKMKDQILDEMVSKVKAVESL